MKYKSVRIKAETYSTLTLIQKTLLSRGVEEKLSSIMGTAINLLKCVVERKIEVNINQLMKVDPLLSLKILSYIYGKMEEQ